jgi:hypothetical protein
VVSRVQQEGNRLHQWRIPAMVAGYHSSATLARLNPVRAAPSQGPLTPPAASPPAAPASFSAASPMPN